MKTKQKKTLARKNYTREDRSLWRSIYTSKFWINRKLFLSLKANK